MTCVFFSLVSADLENIDDGLESLCLSVTEHALSGEFFLFLKENREEFSVYLLRDMLAYCIVHWNMVERCGFKTSIIVLCFLARNATLTVPLSSQEYKWVLKNCQGNWMKQQGYGVMDQLSLQGE